MKEIKGTKLTLTIGETTVSWESPYEDHDMNDLIDAFQGLCVAHTWIPETVVRSFGEWYEGMKAVYPNLKDDEVDE